MKKNVSKRYASTRAERRDWLVANYHRLGGMDSSLNELGFDPGDLKVLGKMMKQAGLYSQKTRVRLDVLTSIIFEARLMLPALAA